MKWLIAAIVLTVTAHGSMAAGIVRDDDFACRSFERVKQLYRLAQNGEVATFKALLDEGFATGDCRRWRKGQMVAEMDRDGGLVCLAPSGTTACYWSPVEAIGR